MKIYIKHFKKENQQNYLNNNIKKNIKIINN